MKPFDGVLFKSVQRDGGTNIVLFPKLNAFLMAYVDNGFSKLFSTKSIKYRHSERKLHLVDGEVKIDFGFFGDSDYDL